MNKFLKLFALLIFFFIPTFTGVASASDDPAITNPRTDEEIIRAADYWANNPRLSSVSLMQENVKQMSEKDFNLINSALTIDGIYIPDSKYPVEALTLALAQTRLVDCEIILGLENDANIRKLAEAYLDSWANYYGILENQKPEVFNCGLFNTNLFQDYWCTSTAKEAARTIREGGNNRFTNVFTDIEKAKTDPAVRKSLFEKALITSTLHNYVPATIETNIWAARYGPDMVPEEYTDLIISNSSIKWNQFKWWVLGSCVLLLALVSAATLMIIRKKRAQGPSFKNIGTLIIVGLLVLFSVTVILIRQHSTDQKKADENQSYRAAQKIAKEKKESERNIFMKEMQQQKFDQALKDADEAVKKLQPLQPIQ